MPLTGVLGNVLGDGDHAPVDDVRSGVVYNNGGLTGTAASASLPLVTDVRLGVSYNDGALTGTMVIPEESNVRLGVGYDVAPNAKTGNVREPIEAQVQLSVAYGTNDTLTGTYQAPTGGYPSEANVRTGILFGASSEFTGQLDLPDISDVRLGVMYDSNTLTGNVRLPVAADVRSGTVYDTLDSVTGTLDPGAGYPAVNHVRDGVTFGSSSEFTGTLDLPGINKVRAGVAFDNGTQIGNSVQPPENKVELNTGYGSQGTEFTGALDCGATGCVGYPDENLVLVGTIYGDSSQYVGNRTDAAQEDVRLGVQYGAQGISHTGTYDCATGDPSDTEWIGQ